MTVYLVYVDNEVVSVHVQELEAQRDVHICKQQDLRANEHHTYRVRSMDVVQKWGKHENGK